MKAWRFNRYGGPDVLSLVPVGAAILVPMAHDRIQYMIVATTMLAREAVGGDNAYRAMRAVLRTAAATRTVSARSTVQVSALASGRCPRCRGGRDGGRLRGLAGDASRARADMPDLSAPGGGSGVQEPAHRSAWGMSIVRTSRTPTPGAGTLTPHPPRS
jgi:hypothetical protein